ncbi:MAG TPA: hypothetical protein VFV44_03950 [Nitrospiraceae bacterium]|nr:hypothetical protein [Nitrospiraceae bacterium]
MPTHPRKHSDDALIVKDILKEAAEPRQAASVKNALDKATPSLSPRKLAVGTRKNPAVTPRH